MALLQGADVGLGVPAGGELLLGQPGGQTGRPDAATDTGREHAVVDDDAGASAWHGLRMIPLAVTDARPTVMHRASQPLPYVW